MSYNALGVWGCPNFTKKIQNPSNPEQYLSNITISLNNFAKVTHVAMSIIGYLPYVSFFIGTLRMAVGTVLYFGLDYIDLSEIINASDRPKAKAVMIGFIARGALECLGMYGKLANALLDASTTFLLKENRDRA